MKNLKKTAVGLALAALPLISEAHPGHQGDHGESIASLILLAAALVAIRHSITTTRARMKRRSKRDAPKL